MPPLDSATGWLGSEPLGPAELRGHVVLVNFWTWTCINWLRQAPYVRAWSQAYRDDGLIVIGVHTPEFRFERDPGGVARAIREREIDHPVAVDSDYGVWRAFANRFWPALYFVDAGGVIRASQFGEGRYEWSERVIQRLLGVERDLVSPGVRGLGLEAEADWTSLNTPETYLGHDRAERFASPGGVAPDQRRAYALPERLHPNTWGLVGEWTVGRESVALGGAGGGIAFRFEARDAHVVMAPATGEPIRFLALVDGRRPGPSHGVDIDADGNGLLQEGRLHQLVRQRDAVHPRTVEITFLNPGAAAYAFTFG